MSKVLSKDSLSVYFSITNVCNFKCDYCLRYYPMKRNPFLTVSKKNIDVLLKQVSKYNLYNFTILGGEPCIVDNTYYLLDKLKYIDLCEITILTNASNIKFFKEVLSYNINNLKITVSYHPKYHSEKYIDNIKYIKDNFNSKIKILMDENYINNIELINKEFDKDVLEYTLIEDMNITADETKRRYINAIGKQCKIINYFNKKYNINLKDYHNLLNLYYNKDCYNNNIIVSTEGIVSYKSCFIKENKNFNIFEDGEYIHNFSKIKCKHKLAGPCSSCKRSYHE